MAATRNAILPRLEEKFEIPTEVVEAFTKGIYGRWASSYADIVSDEEATSGGVVVEMLGTIRWAESAVRRSVSAE